MNIGYACLPFFIPGPGFRSLRKNNVNPDTLREVISHNLNQLDRIIDYNGLRGIHLFRITSDLIPFGSSPLNSLDWGEEFRGEWEGIGQKIREFGIRVSMHPGQYTVLNSPNPKVVENAISDLAYHAKVLDLLGMEPSSKIVLHVGGVYGDRGEALRRFALQFRGLSEDSKRRLILENDDRSFTIGDVLNLAGKIGIPVVYDNLHDEINPTDLSIPSSEWIHRAAQSWKPVDGPQKIHYSQQAANKPRGAHSETIFIDRFLDFISDVGDADVMLEVKDKDRSAIKCSNCLRRDPEIRHLEEEWFRYKFLVLEHDPHVYRDIQALLKDKSGYPALPFYHLIEKALLTSVFPGRAKNALEHMAGFISRKLSEQERELLRKNIQKARNGAISIEKVKMTLSSFSTRFEEESMLFPYYFGN